MLLLFANNKVVSDFRPLDCSLPGSSVHVGFL